MSATNALRSHDLRHVWHPFQQSKTYADVQFMAVAGDGPYLVDDTGCRYLDAISGLWCVSLGYSERRVTDAIAEQLRRLPFLSLFVGSHEPSIRLARELAGRGPEGLDVTIFASGGAEGVETALKLARHYACIRKEPARRKILALEGAYHGMTYGALSATGIADDRWQFGPLLPEIVHSPSPYSLLRATGTPPTGEACIAELTRALRFHGPDTFAAVIVEPIMGVAGMIPPPEGYLEAIRRLCDEHSILLIFDEVTTGCGRTGHWLAADTFAVIPDMIVLAKGLTSGYLPLGAVLVRSTIQQACECGPTTTFMHGFTFGGNPAACAAALACLDVLKMDGLLEKVRADGDYLLERFLWAFENIPMVRNIRGRGLLAALDLCTVDDPLQPASREFSAAVRRAAREKGVIIRPTPSGGTFNFAPPFICTRSELDRIVDVTRAAIVTALKTVPR
jgi:adenosylmethionine-8-amino-7-oxononanoate aminotransferase